MTFDSFFQILWLLRCKLNLRKEIHNIILTLLFPYHFVNSVREKKVFLIVVSLLMSQSNIVYGIILLRSSRYNCNICYQLLGHNPGSHLCLFHHPKVYDIQIKFLVHVYIMGATIFCFWTTSSVNLIGTFLENISFIATLKWNRAFLLGRSKYRFTLLNHMDVGSWQGRVAGSKH